MREDRKRILAGVFLVAKDAEAMVKEAKHVRDDLESHQSAVNNFLKTLGQNGEEMGDLFESGYRILAELLFCPYCAESYEVIEKDRISYECGYLVTAEDEELSPCSNRPKGQGKWGERWWSKIKLKYFGVEEASS